MTCRFFFQNDLDLEKFFDRLNHDILMSRVARRVKDERIVLECPDSHDHNSSNRRVRTRMPGGVAGAQLIAAPYADCPALAASCGWGHSSAEDAWLLLFNRRPRALPVTLCLTPSKRSVPLISVVSVVAPCAARLYQVA